MRIKDDTDELVTVADVLSKIEDKTLPVTIHVNDKELYLTWLATLPEEEPERIMLSGDD